MNLTLGGKTIELALLNQSDLRPHEETVRHAYDELEASMRQDELQRDPIIVDKKSGVVLDGTHRLEVLRRLGAKLVACYLVDYASKDVRLLRWLRAVKRPTPKLLFRLERELNLVFGGSELLEAPTKIELWYRGDKLESRRDVDFPEICEVIRRFDQIVAQEDAIIEFMDEEAFRHGAVEADVSVLVTPRIQKSHVILAAKSGALLPPKSSLHVFPVRPMGVDYPIEFLKSGRDELDQRLARRPLKTIEPPVVIGGRRYREEILVFEQVSRE